MVSRIHAIDQQLKSGLVFHDFLGRDIFHLHDLKAIQPTDFQLFFSDFTDINTERNAYLKTFNKLLEAIQNERFSKVILSRIKTASVSKNALTIFNELNENYENTFNYLISSPAFGTWIGATPETLLNINQLDLATMSLAGTKKPSESWTAKEKEEQQLVTDTILRNLQTSGCQKIQVQNPTTVKAGKIEHLQSLITAQLPLIDNWHKVVKELHPTPAVCGIPKHEAQTFIQEIEAHDRQFYTGYIGVLNGDQKKFFVNLRCMELFEHHAKVYVGGGITKDSVGINEWEETERKSQTLMDVLVG